jgi:hypothetical protein
VISPIANAVLLFAGAIVILVLMLWQPEPSKLMIALVLLIAIVSGASIMVHMGVLPDYFRLFR